MSDRGLRVGDAIALAGFDDTPWFGTLNPPLTVIAQDVPSLGTQALSVLQSLIDGDDVGFTDIELPVHLRVRGSCALPTAPRQPTRTAGRST